MEKSIWIRMISSTPIVGTALALWIEHTEMGIAQYGTLIGLMRGTVIGFVIAITLLSASEAAIAVFDVVREEVKLRCTYQIIAGRREAAERRSIEEVRRHRMHHAEHPEYIRSSIAYYAVDQGKHARTVGASLTPHQVLEFLHRWQRQAVSSNALETLRIGASVRPFFFNADGNVARWDVEGKGECVLAEFENNIILIPLPAYRNAGLPMKGDVSHDQE